MNYLEDFFIWTKFICWVIEKFVLFYRLFEFAVQRIPAIRNNAEIIYSQRSTRITAMLIRKSSAVMLQLYFHLVVFHLYVKIFFVFLLNFQCLCLVFSLQLLAPISCHNMIQTHNHLVHKQRLYYLV